jgi:hypothetical protein
MRRRNLRRPIKEKEPEKIIIYSGKSPTEREVKSRGYVRTISSVIADIDSEIYLNHFSVNALKQHAEWMDTKWVVFMEKLEKQKLKLKLKRKVKKSIKIPRIHRWRGIPKFTGQSIRPSQKFGNTILARFLTLQSKYVRYIDKAYDVKKNTSDKVKNARKVYAKHITYYTDFIDNYYEIWGCTKSLISNLIKSGYLDYVILIFKRELSINNIIDTVFIEKYINVNLITKDIYDKLLNNGLDLSSDIRILLTMSNEQAILKNIDNLNTESIILKNVFKYNKFSSVIDKLINLQIIPSDKKSIDSYYKTCNIGVLVSLLKNNKLKFSQVKFNSLFKKTKTVTLNKFRRRRYDSRYYKLYNPTLDSKRKEVDTFLELLISKNIKIPYSIPFHEYLKSSSNLDSIVRILDSNKIIEYPFDNKFGKLYSKLSNSHSNGSVKNIKSHPWDKIITRVIKSDNIELFKKILDYNLLMIEELHQQAKSSNYISMAITNNSRNIAKYMIKDLKMKFLNYNSRTLWGWRINSVPEAQIIKNIKLITELGIPICQSMLTTMFENKKNKVVEYLIDEVKLTLCKSHLQYIQIMDNMHFNKYMDLLKIDKLKLINSLVKNPTEIYRWYRRTNGLKDSVNKNKNITSIIEEQKPIDKKKIAKRTAIIAITNNNSRLFSSLVSKYKFDIDLKNIIKIINNKKYSCKNHVLYNIIKKRPELLNQIKEGDDDIKLKLLTTGINEASVTAVNIKHFAELDVNINLDLIGDLFDKAYTRSWYRGDRLDYAQIVALTKLIHLLPEFKDVSNTKELPNSENKNKYEDLKKVILHLLTRSDGIKVLNKLCTDKLNFFEMISMKDIYTACLIDINKYNNITNTLLVLNKISTCKNIQITPFIWTLIKILEQYRMANGNLNYWNKFSVKSKDILKILGFCKQITKEDKEYFKTRFKGKRPKIVNYEILLSELPDNYNNYTRFIDVNENKILNNNDEMDIALDEAAQEIIQEMQEKIDVDINSDEDVYEDINSDVDSEENDGMKIIKTTY